MSGISKDTAEQQRPDLLHETLAELEARGVPTHRPLTDLERDLFIRRLIDRGAEQLIERSVQAAGVHPVHDHFSDQVQNSWVKCLYLLHGLSLDDLRVKCASSGQFAGLLWTMARNRTVDHHRSQKKAAAREIPLNPGFQEEGGLSEEVIAMQGWVGSNLTDYEKVDMLIDWRHWLEKLKSSAINTASPQGRDTLPRFLALIEMDFQRVIEEGRLPSTEEVCRELGFPSPATVSIARRRYREMARECFAGWWGQGSA